MADTATLQLKVDSRPVKAAEDHLIGFTKAGAAAEDQANDLAGAAGRLKPPLSGAGAGAGAAVPKFNNLANTARQTSLQLSQVAQQGAATGNFMQALAIQIPDLLLPFGTLAIVVGAVAGAFAGPLINAIKGSTVAIDDFVDGVRDGEVALDDLSDAQVRVFERSQSALINETAQNIAKYKEELRQAKEQTSLLGDIDERNARIRAAGYGSTFKAVEISNKQAIEQKENIDNITIALEAENKKLEEQKQILKEVQQGFTERSNTSLQSSLDSVRGRLSPAVAARQAFEARNEVIQMSNDQLGITQAEYDRLRIQNAQQLQDELTSIEEDGAKQRGQFLTTEQTRTLGATGQFFGNLAQVAKAGGKDQFDNYKNLASAQAGVSSALSILSVLGDPLIPTLTKPAFAAAIGALGAVQIAQIQSQEYQPRALGGQMKSGGSFLVGERGPELVTMGNRNANITPNNQLGGGGGPVQMTNVFQISTGVAETAQSEILRFVPIFENIAVNAVNKAARAGGSTSRIVGAR